MFKPEYNRQARQWDVVNDGGVAMFGGGKRGEADALQCAGNLNQQEIYSRARSHVCDVCDKPAADWATFRAYGIETTACEPCRRAAEAQAYAHGYRLHEKIGTD